MADDPARFDPDIQRLALAAAASLLKRERVALKAIRSVLRRHASEADASIRRLSGSDAGRIVSEGSGVLRRAATHMDTDLTGAIAGARSAARSQALTSIGEQLAAIESKLLKATVPLRQTELVVPLRGHNEADAVHAEAAAKSLSSKWLQQSVGRLIDQQDAHGPLPSIGEQVAAEIDFRVRRTAATESSQAFNNEADDILGIVGDRIDGTPAGAIVWKRWESVLDRVVCGRCANFDNQVVRANEEFRGGEVPGYVHPQCRCIEVLALHAADLNVAHAVTREMFGPGLGRAAHGQRDNFENAHQWTDEERAEWTRRYGRAKVDASYRSRLLRFEIRRHEDSAAAGREVASALVPRLRSENVMARDRRSTRQVHDDAKGQGRDWRARRDRAVPIGARIGEGFPTTKQAPWYPDDGRKRPPGKLDESRRAFKWSSEKRIAEYLVSKGNLVAPAREGNRADARRNADAFVNHRRTEFKALKPMANSRRAMRSIEDSMRRGGQARNIVLDARGSGLSEQEARRTFDRVRPLTRGRLRHILIIGDGYQVQSSEFD